MQLFMQDLSVIPTIIRIPYNSYTGVHGADGYSFRRLFFPFFPDSSVGNVFVRDSHIGLQACSHLLLKIDGGIRNVLRTSQVVLSVFCLSP